MMEGASKLLTTNNLLTPKSGIIAKYTSPTPYQYNSTIYMVAISARVGYKLGSPRLRVAGSL